MKINEKNLAAFATSGNQVDRLGYLMKKGDGNKSFAKRWFVLKGNLLFYFEKRNDREPIGVIILEGSTIELAESELEEHFCFKIVFPSRSYILSSDSQQDMEQWMKSLACSSYDYVKLMAAELQRQLDELCSNPTHEANDQGNSSLSHPFPSLTENATLNQNANYPPSGYGQVPTPPPRHRTTRNQRPNQKRIFASLHEEFGTKILQDQQRRWATLSVTSHSKSSNHDQLSLMKADTLIDI